MHQQFSGIEILDQICQTKMKRLQTKGMSLGYTLPKKRPFPIVTPTLLHKKDSPIIIAEIKRKSPTKGYIGTITEPTKLAKTYIEQGANAISVLCEEDYFQGSLQDLYAIKEAFPHTCILRKDFILHKDEIEVSYLFGADMVLLIVALFVNNMESFCVLYNELLSYNLTPLIEIHTLAEWDLIKQLDLKHAIIGINARNLKTFQINKMDAMKLRACIPQHIAVVFESGIQSNYDGFMAGSSGFQGILCGSFLVEHLDTQHENTTQNVLYELAKAFHIGTNKLIFARLLQRFYTKNPHIKQNAKKHINKPLIKVCGINDIAFLQESMLHADLLGFILTPKSVRYVDMIFMQEATRIYNAYCMQHKHLDFMPLRIGVVTKECIDIGISYLEQGFIDCLQLHDIPTSFCIKHDATSHNNTESFYGTYPISALHNTSNNALLPFYPSIDYKKLLHTNQTLQTHFALWDSSGGKGQSIDIMAIQNFMTKHITLQGNLWLAGGICTKNLRELLTLNPMLLDICSGFENEQGKKSIIAMQTFFSLLESIFDKVS